MPKDNVNQEFSMKDFSILFETMFMELFRQIEMLKSEDLELVYTKAFSLAANGGEAVHFRVQGSNPRWWILQNLGNYDVYFSQGERVTQLQHVIPADKLFHFIPIGSNPTIAFKNLGTDVGTIVVSACSISPNLY